MVELLFICGIFGFLFVVLKHLIDKAAYKRKLARIQAEIDARRSNRRSDWDEIYSAGLRQYDEQPPPTRKHCKPEIDKFLDVKRKTRIIIFDVETNGLNGDCSVLSCSAIKYEIDPKTYAMTEIDRFDRYYYPAEEFDPQAVAVNGLTRDMITEKRGNATYPKCFTEDPDFQNFCNGVLRFVAHNISFDCRFIPFIERKKKLCTMMTNMDIVAVQYLERKRQWKWPKLSETANYYGIAFNEYKLHGSMVDTEITAQIFMKMLHATKSENTTSPPSNTKPVKQI